MQLLVDDTFFQESDASKSDRGNQLLTVRLDFLKRTMVDTVADPACLMAVFTDKVQNYVQSFKIQRLYFAQTQTLYLNTP